VAGAAALGALGGFVGDGLHALRGARAAEVLSANPLVYGPSADGALATLAEELGGETLTDLEKPMELTWEQFSQQTLDNAVASNRQVVFDLTNMNDIPGVLNGTAYSEATTSFELRYIQSNWSLFSRIVKFLNNGQIVGAPW
jgi:hypothetical protein